MVEQTSKPRGAEDGFALLGGSAADQSMIRSQEPLGRGIGAFVDLLGLVD